jgi:uncharacterized protein (TIGR04141 family)
MEGRWFAVAQTLISAVDAYCDSLPETGIDLPVSTRVEKEVAYNKRLADSDSARLLCLDAKIKRPGGASSGIEVCDIMTIDGEFLHIKRKSRSSTLSHLFAQGSVSIETFIDDGRFRDAIRVEIETRVSGELRQQWLDIIPPGSDRVNVGRYTVSYAIIASTRTGKSWLPFFSKRNLMQHGKRLTNFGVKVTASRIDVVKSLTTSRGAD